MPNTSHNPVLNITDLKVDFHTLDGVVPAVSGVDLYVNQGESTALVGESGSGKSVTAMSILRLLKEPPAELSGSIRLTSEGGKAVDVLDLKKDSRQMRSVRGAQAAMIFQEPMRALSPVFTIGHQVAEAVWLHRDVSRKDACMEAVRMLDRVGIPEPSKRIHDYPHNLSGGQRQRVMIAMALVCRPALLIADEPTTALDVTIQAQILELLQELQQELGLAVLFITHDLGIVAGTCSRVSVMYMGSIVETADVYTIYEKPAHPYTQGLIASVPVPGEGHKTKLKAIGGSVPDPRNLPEGCPFGPRCSFFEPGLCNAPGPVKNVENGKGHFVRCYRTKETIKNVNPR
ncbi:MAG: ABC transporter ATP-binding protein [Verrucomicrobiota bacterium]